MHGHAIFTDRETVMVDDVEYSADHYIIATGGRPIIPNIPGNYPRNTILVLFEIVKLNYSNLRCSNII